jgi:2TM domain-containing protein
MSESGIARTLDLDERERRLRRVAVERVRRRRNLRLHVVATVVASVFVTLVWATTEYHNAGGWPTGFRTGRMNRDWDPWVMYPLLAGLVALAVHAWAVYGRTPTSEREVQRELERMRAENAV